MTGSRPSEAVHLPLYARLLRLRHLAPSGFLCFVYFEGAVALGILLALAELVSWWGVLVLPAVVALMVKLNDAIAGMLVPAAPSGTPASARAAVVRPAGRSGHPADVRAAVPPGGAARPVRLAEEATTRLPGVIVRGRDGAVMRPWAEQVELQQQRIRHSATRRYE